MTKNRRIRARRGAAIVEFALLAPIVMALLLGIWEVGCMLEFTQVLTNAAREGARQASTETTYDKVVTAVQNYLTAAGVNQTGVKIQVTNVTTNSHGPQTHGTGIDDYDPSTAAQLDLLKITVTLPYTNQRWSTTHMFTTTTATMTGTTNWPCLKDADYPNAVTVPAGS
jgi:Flp pilus assembly protein TadG